MGRYNFKYTAKLRKRYLIHALLEYLYGKLANVLRKLEADF